MDLLWEESGYGVPILSSVFTEEGLRLVRESVGHFGLPIVLTSYTVVGDSRKPSSVREV